MSDERRGGSVRRSLLLAVCSFALGVGAAWFALRPSAAPPAKPDQEAESASTGSGHAAQSGAGGEHAGEHPAQAEGNTVYISPARQQLIGVRTAVVGRQALDASIRTVGVLAFDETRVAQIHTKVAGWVDKVFVDYVGRRVARGEPLLSLYSPELVATQNEYLLALRADESLAADAVGGLPGLSLASMARDRLALWDISDAQIEALRRTGRAQKMLRLFSPFDGIVLERSAFPGQYITPETATFRIADLSTIWVIGEIFEYELRRVKAGQAATIEFPYGQENHALEGTITYVYPTVDPQTRRVKVRAEFPNPGLELKPSTYVTLVIRAAAAQQLAIPKEAVIDSGAKRYALLAHPNGYFEPRELKLGEPVDEFFPVVAGVAEGDTVVTSAQFLIDSETNLQSAMQAMSMSMPGMDAGGGRPQGEAPEPTPATPQADDPHRSHGH